MSTQSISKVALWRFFPHTKIQTKIVSHQGKLHFEEEEEGKKNPDNALSHSTSKMKELKIIFEHWLFGCLIPDISPVSILSASFILFQICPLVQRSCLRDKKVPMKETL